MALTAQDRREIATIFDAIMMKHREGQAIADPTQNLLNTIGQAIQLQALGTRIEQSPGIQMPGSALLDELLTTVIVPSRRKKAMSKFNQAVKKGMAAVRASPSYGKKGTINNPKKAFSAVTKTVSKVRRGKAKPKKGILKKVAGIAAKLVSPHLKKYDLPKRKRAVKRKSYIDYDPQGA
jgi:hypothetical protein